MTLSQSGGLPPNIDLLQNVIPYLDARYAGWSPGITVSPNGGPGGDGGDFGPNTVGTTTNGCFEANAFGVQLGGSFIFLVGGITWFSGVAISPLNQVLVPPLSITAIGGVSQILPGTNITISPVSGSGIVTINSASTTGVSKIVAGSNISISPISGSGIVTVNVSSSSIGSPIARVVNSQLSVTTPIVLINAAPNIASNVFVTGLVSSNTSASPSGLINISVAWTDAYTGISENYPWINNYWILPSGIVFLPPMTLTTNSGVLVSVTATASIANAMSVSTSMLQL